MGELDVYEQTTVYVELHNFDFISSNATKQNTLYATPSSSSSTVSNKEINYINHIKKSTTTRSLRKAIRLRIHLPPDDNNQT